ncbi:MAG: aspartate aminotransferase family protein, partial [Desulfurococcaceae archaeon]
MAGKSERLFNEALALFPGGVHSPIRGRVKPHPYYVERAEGARLYTVDGVVLLDYCMSYGALILGHGDLRVRGVVED